MGSEVVRCDHLDHLVLVGGERPAQGLGSGQVLRPALMPRQRLVGHMAHEILEEAVLAMLGRAGIRLDAEHLLAREGREQGLDVGVGVGKPGQRVSREGLAEHGRVLEQPPLVCGEAVEPGGDQRMQRLRHLERLHRAGQPVRRALLDEQAAVEEHAHRLDRIQRDAFRPGENLLAQRVGQSGHEAGQELLHRLLRQRLEVEGGEAALSGAPIRPALQQLRSGQGDHEDR